MTFLDAGGRIAVDHDEVIAQALHLPTVAAGQSHGDGPQFVRDHERADNIRRVSARRDANHDISLADEAFDLLAEDGLKPVVVAEGSQHGGIGGERQNRERSSVHLEAPDELGSHVLGIRGAPAVAHDIHAVIGLKGLRDRLGGGLDDTGVLPFERANGLQGFVDEGLDSLLAHGLSPLREACA